MDEKLQEAEQGLANEFGEKLDVTETPVTPASDSASFTPDAPVAPVEAPADAPAQA